jgi:hypothetical protein
MLPIRTVFPRLLMGSFFCCQKERAHRLKIYSFFDVIFNGIHEGLRRFLSKSVVWPEQCSPIPMP